MNKFRKTTNILLFICLIATSLSEAFAHEGHDKAPGEEATSGSGPISISHEAKENLALEVYEAEIRTIDKSIPLLGQIEAIPVKRAAVTSRISGRITALYVNEGQRLTKGAELVEIESRQPGAPRVKYLAPIDGILTDQHAVIGDTVEPDKHIMEVVNLSEVYVEGRIYEGQVSSIRIGQRVRAVVESFPTEVFEGSVELLGGSLDPETRTLKVWARVNNPELKLRPNMRATLNVIAGESASSISIPKSGVLGEMGHAFVFVQSEADPLTYERRNIVTGVSDDRYIEVIEGILPGDKVVVAGNYQLQYVPPTNKKIEDADHVHHEKSDGTIIPIFIGIALGCALSFGAARFMKRSA